MGSVVDQLRLSIWKHVTIRKRQPVILALELLWPIVVFLIVAGVRQVIPPKERPDCVYNARALPSAGMMPFMQSFVCNLDNACQRISTYEEIPTYRNSQIATVIHHLQPLVDKPELHTVLTELRHSMHLATLAVTSLSKPQVKEILGKEYKVGNFFKNQSAAQDTIANSLLLSQQAARSLLESKVNFGQLLVAAQKSPMDIICDAKVLAKVLSLPDSLKASELSSKMCNFNVAKEWPSLLMIMVEVDVSHVCNTVKVVLESFGDKDLAEVVTAIGDIVDVVQSIPIISSLGKLDLESFNTASLTDIAQYLSNALEMFDSLKTAKIDFTFLSQILQDVRSIVGHNELLEHALALGEHISKLADIWINKKPQNDNPNGLELKFEDLLKNNNTLKTALSSIDDVSNGDIDHLLDAQVKLDKLDNLSKFSSGLEICEKICSSDDDLQSVLDLKSGSNAQLKIALCRPEVCPLNVREDILPIKNRIARNLRSAEQKFNTSSLAAMVDDIMHHTKHISQALGPFLRKTYPAADFFWKSTTAIMSVLGLPQWNTSHALMSLIPIVESFPTYMPSEAKIPFLNLMSAAQLSVGFASRISQKAAELDEILFKIVKSNSESLTHMLSLGPSIIDSLVTVFTQESTHKILLDKPANLSEMFCQDSSLHKSLNLPKEVNAEALQFFLCSLPVAEMTTNLYQSIITDEAIRKIEAVMMSSVFNSTDEALKENIHSFFEQLASLVQSVQKIVTASENWNTFLSTLQVPGQNLTESNWQSVRNKLEAAKYQTILSLYASLLGRNLDGLYFNSALDGDKTMAALLDIMNALSEEAGDIPAYFLENIADNWSDVIRVFLDSLKDVEKRSNLLEVQSWSNITCHSDHVGKYLAFDQRTDKDKTNFTNLLCNITSYIESDILGVAWTERPLFKTICNVAEGRERDKRRKLSWQSTLDDVSSIFKKYSPVVVKMIQSSQDFHSLAHDAKEVFAMLPSTDIIKFCVNVMSISFKFVDKQLEPLDLWAWKNVKGLTSVLELLIQTANTQLERAIARGRLEVADVMLDLPTFTVIGQNIIQFLPHLLEGVTNTLLKDFGDFVIRLTEADTSLIPCGGVSIADLVKLSPGGDKSLRSLENIFCNQSRVLLSEIIKLPLSFRMLWKVRDANKGVNIEIDWDGFSNDLKRLTDNVEKLVKFDGDEIFTEVEGFKVEDLVKSWENMKAQFQKVTPITGARMALSALDAGMPFIINATLAENLADVGNMVQLLDVPSKDAKAIGYQIFTTFRAVLKTANILISDFNQFLIKLPAVNATLKDLVGASGDMVLVNLLENMPDYLSILVHTIADSKFPSMLEHFFANGTFDFSSACYETSPVYSTVVIPANVSLDKTQVLDTVCKAMSDPKHYFAVEPYVDTWIARTIDKIVSVWKHQSPSSINVKFANIMDNVIFLVNDAAPIIHRSSNITQYFSNLLDKSKWERMINGLADLPALSQSDWWKQFVTRNIIALANLQAIDSASFYVIHAVNSTVANIVEGMKQFNGTEVFSLKDIMANTELRKLVSWLENNLIDAVKILGYTVIKDAAKFQALIAQPDAWKSICSSPPNTFLTPPPDDDTLNIILPELCSVDMANIIPIDISDVEAAGSDGYNSFAHNLINLVESAKEFPSKFPQSHFWAPFMNESAWQSVLLEFKSRDENVSQHLKEVFKTISQLANDSLGLRITLKTVEVVVSLMSKSLDLVSIGVPLESGNLWNSVKDWYRGKYDMLLLLNTLEQLPNITALTVNTLLHPVKLKTVIEKVLMVDNKFEAFCNSTPEELFQAHRLVAVNGHYLQDLICRTNFTRLLFDIDPFSIPAIDSDNPFDADAFVDRLVKVSESLAQMASPKLNEEKKPIQIMQQIPWMDDRNWGIISRVAEDFLFEKLGSMNLLIHEIVGFISLVELVPYWKYPQRVFQLLNMQTKSVLDGLNPQILKMGIYGIVSNETVIRAIIQDVRKGLDHSSDIPYVYSILPMMEYFEKYPEKQEFFCGSNPDRSWTMELMSADLAGTSVDAEKFMDVLCNQKPSTWFNTLVHELGVSGQKLRSVFQNAMTILPLESEWYTEKRWQNSAPFNWTMLADNINVFMNTLENMPPDFFPDFKWSSWKPVVTAFAKVMPEIVQLGGESICNSSFLDLDFWFFQEGLHLLVKQLSLFDEYEKLLCDLPTLNMTSVYRILKEDFGVIDALATIRKLFNRLVVMDIKRICSDCVFLSEEFEISDGNGTCIGTVSQASKALDLATSVIFSFIESSDKFINLQFCALQALQTTVLEEFDLYEKLIGKALPLLNMPNMAFAKPGTLRPLFQSLLDFIKDQVPVYVPWKTIAKVKDVVNDGLTSYEVITNSSVNVNRLEQIGFDSSKLAYVFCSVPKLEKLFELPIDAPLSSEDTVKNLCPNLETAQKYAKKFLEDIGTDMIRSNLPKWRSDNVISWDRLLSLGRRFRTLTDSVTRVSRSVGGLDFSLLKNLNKKVLIEKATLIVREKTLDAIESSLKTMATGLEPYIRGSNFEDDLLKLAKAVIIIKDFLVKELATVSFSLGEVLTDEAYVRSYLREEIKLNERTIGSVLNSPFNFTAMIVMSGFVSLEELLCDPGEMTNIVSFKDDPNAPILLTNSLCHFVGNFTVSKRTAEIIVNHLDMSKIVGQFVGAIVQSFSGKANLTAEDTYRAFKSLRLASQALPEVTDIVRDFVRDINITELIGGLNPDRLALGEITAETMLGLGNIMCGHPIRTFVEYFKLLQDSSHQTDENRNVQELKSLPTSLCKRIYRQVANRPSGSIVWGYVKPILRGKILYAPNNELAKKIIQEANKTYSEIAKLTDMVDVWSEGFEKLGTFVDEHLQETEELMALPMAKSVITGILGREQLFDGNLTITETLQKMGNPQRYLSMTKLLVEGLECFETDRFIGYDTEEEMMAAAYNFKADNNFMAGIVFEDFETKRPKRSVDPNTGLPKHLKYKLRLDIDDAPSTKFLKEKFWKPGPEDNFIEKLRYLRGFLVLQDMIDQAFIRAQAGGTEPIRLPGTYVQQFPYPCFDDDDFGFFLRVNVPTVTTLAWIFLIAFFIRELVLEREVMLEQIMKMMGLRGWINWLSWFFNCFAAMTCIVAAIVIIFKVGGIFPFSDWKILFFFLMDFAFALLMFCYLVSTFFTTATIASLTGVLLYLMSYLPFIIIMILEPQLSFAARILMNLVMSTSFSQGCLYLTRYEEQREGIQFSNLWSSPIPRDEMSFGWSCVMLGVDGVLYFLLALYFSYVLPTNGLNGRKPWYFVFLPRYWKNGSSKKQSVYVVPPEGPMSFHDAILSGSSFSGNDLKKSKDSKEPIGISLRGLRKVYNEGQTLEKVAVDGLTVDFFEGQITTLLGQNGAGKTTTINMLTGLSTPTAGSAQINGKDTVAEAKASRKSLGICPQYNILFDLLTIREHLDFYGQLKGTFFGAQLKQDVDSLLESMGLWHKQDEVVCNLSGGMKRRVCVAIAFVGGSRTVILDEPTSGVDPVARRQIWDLIVQHKPGRTILLTTHYLDEADILSDRVAIMHAGKLLCIGSPLQLKRKFGAGYHLAVGKHETDYGSDTDSGALSNCSSGNEISNCSGYDTEAIVTFLRSHIPNADFEEETNTEVVFSLPYYKDNGSLNTFDEVFFQLEKHQERLGIENFGLSCTTLEEVFLNVCSQADSGLPITSRANKALMMARHAEKLKAKIVERDQAKHSAPAMTFSGFTSRQPLKGRSLKLSQLSALLSKRFYHARRDWRSFLTAVILPCVFVALAMGFSLVRPDAGSLSPSLRLTPSLYGPDSTSFIKVNDNSSDLARRAANAMFEPPGIGTSCLWTDPDDTLHRNIPACVFGPGQAPLPAERTNVTFHREACRCDPQVEVCAAKDLHYEYTTQKTNTTDIVYDFTEGSLPEWIIATENQFIERRYGGWVFGAKPSSPNPLGSPENVIVWFNNKGHHAIPSYLNSLGNAMLRAHTGSNPNSPTEYGITAYSHPMHLSKMQLGMEALLHHVADVGISLVFLVAFSFIPASFIIYPVKERTREEKRLQFVSGVGPILYWSSAFFWDCLMLLVPVALSAIIIASFNQPVYVQNYNFIAVILLLFLYGWATTPLMYLLEKLFDEASLASMVLFCVNIFIGINTTVCVMLLYVFQSHPGMGEALGILRYLFLVFPQYAFCGGLFELTKSSIQAEVFMRFGHNSYVNPFSMDLLGINFIVLTLQGILFFALNIIFEFRPAILEPKYGKAKGMTSEEDDDVRLEKQKIHNNEGYGDMVRLKDLTKVYRGVMGKTLAVDKLCLGIPKGECFGLLGINGAGKTTTFKMLTGEIHPSDGEVLIKHQSVSDVLSNGHQIIGYCPQTNAIDDLLTADEMLYVYAKLRGVRSEDLPFVSHSLMTKFNLQTHARRLTKTYSLGTKRKLCTAISVLGDPELVLMDEPTSGMDPSTRRLVWDNVLQIIKDKRSVILTSHSMEECDTLCTRLAIMVNGKLRCLGSPQYLKNKFGDGYTVTLRVHEEPQDWGHIVTFMRGFCPDAVLKAQHYSTVEFLVPLKNASLGEIFSQLESAKLNLGIDDFSVTQTTLDQVFVNFVREQADGLVNLSYDLEEVSSSSGNGHLQAQNMHLENEVTFRNGKHMPTRKTNSFDSTAPIVRDSDYYEVTKF